MNYSKRFKELTSDLADDFKLYRDGKFITTIKAFFCSNEYPNSIQTIGSDIIKENDQLFHVLTEEYYNVYSLKPLSSSGELHGYIVTYSEPQTGSNIYNIQNVTGNSAIGTNSTFNLMNQSSEDILSIIDESLPFSEEKTELLKELLAIKNSEGPIEPSRLAKFSDLIKKHENLIPIIGSFLTKVIFRINK